MAIKLKADDNNISLKVGETNEATLSPSSDVIVIGTDPEPVANLNASEPNTAKFNIQDYVRFGGGGSTSDYEDLSNKPSINGETLVGDKTAAQLGLMPYIDLGTFNVEDFDWDYWEYLNTITETGFYKAHEEMDGFDYFVRVERAGDAIYQEVWSTEENGFARYIRTGAYWGEEWHWDQHSTWMTGAAIAANYYNKSAVDNLLNGKVDDATLGNYYTDAQVDDILENNYYNMDTIDEMFEQFSPTANNMVETTWANLVSLRDNGQLTKGAWYRITDYNFVTTKLDVQSGGHQFDIIVLAISESMLSESAYAAKHAGDHYFEREVTEGGIEWLYTLYVDDYGDSYGDEPMDHQDDLHASDEFCDSGVLPHPDTGIDVPVLYKTDTGEYSFDDPDYDDAYFYEGTYDLDGDDYDMWAKYEYNADDDEWVFMMQYALTPIVVEDGELIVSPIPETKIVPVNMNAWEIKYCLDNDKALFDWAETDGKGVIYYLKDEFGNEAPYDFKNIKFRRYLVSGVSDSVLNGLVGLYLAQDGYFGITRNSNSKFYYTFADINGTGDGSLFGESAYNTIEPYIYVSPKGANIKGLNNIVLQLAEGNRFSIDCFNITILGSAKNNDFNNCYAIAGRHFTGCSFANNTHGHTFDRIQNGTFNASAWQIMGNGTDGATFGTSAHDIVLGSNASSTVFGSGCYNIRTGSWCYSNTFGNGAANITLGNYCSQNTIGKNCSNVTFTNYYRYVNIKDAVSRLNFTTTGGNTSNYVEYVTVEMGVSNVSIAPLRRQSYEQVYYKTGRTQTAL